MAPDDLIERFDSLNKLPMVRHLFIRRIPGIDVAHDKAEAVSRLEAIHREIRGQAGMGDWPLITAEQIHASNIAVVEGLRTDHEFPGCDGLITNQRRVALGIRVADCCAVYIVEPKTPAIGLVHSGKKGTEQSIVSQAIEQMNARFGSQPGELIVQLSPCIRPPHYEIDFAAQIIGQAKSMGVRQIHDSGTCTACDLNRYYSYRAEKGKTGRMLALLGLD